MLALPLLPAVPAAQVWKAEHEGVQQELVDEGDQAAVSWLLCTAGRLAGALRGSPQVALLTTFT